MPDAEYWMIGGAFALCAFSLFCVVVPLYALRHGAPGKAPPLPSGKVKTTGMGLLDVVGVGLFFAMYAGGWLMMQHGDPGAVAPAESPEAGMEGQGVMLLGEMVLQAMMIGFVVMILGWRVSVIDLFGLRWRHSFLLIEGLYVGGVLLDTRFQCQLGYREAQNAFQHFDTLIL